MRVVNLFGYPESLILDPMKNTADPDPRGSDPRSRGCDPGSQPVFRPLIPDPIYLATTLITSCTNQTFQYKSYENWQCGFRKSIGGVWPSV